MTTQPHTTPATAFSGSAGHIHNAFYKRLFSIESFVVDFIRYFLLALIPGEVDFSSLIFYSETGITRNRAERRGDMIWRIRTYQGRWIFLFILTEFQHSKDPWMAVRMAEYVTVFLRKICSTEEVKASGQLPLVLPIVIYSGEAPWAAAESLDQLFPRVPEPLCRYQPQQMYYLLDIGRLAQELLDNDASVAARFFEMERAYTPEQMERAVQHAAAYLAHNPDLAIHTILCQWVCHVAMPRLGLTTSDVPETLSLEEMGTMINTQLERWKEDKIRQLREQVVQEVRQEVVEEVRVQVEQEVRQEVEQEIRQLLQQAQQEVQQAQQQAQQAQQEVQQAQQEVQQAQQSASFRIATKLAAMHMDAAHIVRATGLSPEDVQRVLADTAADGTKANDALLR